MTIKEINERVHELEKSVELLKAIRKDYIDQNRSDCFISALDDGIKYTSLRLQDYQMADWIML